MKARKHALWVLLLVLGFAVMAGGCGGGGGGDSSAVTPSQPETPSQPDNPTPPATDDLSAYSGTWTAVPDSESINVTGYGGPYTLEIASGVTDIDFSSVTSSSATALVSSYFEYDVFDSSGDYVYTLPSGYDNETVQASRPAANRISYTFPDGSTINITINSETSITVTESGTFTVEEYRFQYSGSYDMVKTD